MNGFGDLGHHLYFLEDKIMNKQIIIAITLCMMFIGVVSADSTIGIDSGSGDTTMPLYVANGTNVGSIQVNLTYDPSVVNVTGVTGSNMDNMLANLEHANDGCVRIIAYQSNSPGATGDFIIAQVAFKPTFNSGTCPVNIDVTTFKDSTPRGNKMAYNVRDGIYTAVGGGGGHGGGGGSGTYPPDPTPTMTAGEPGNTPTSIPTPIPTVNLPCEDICNQGYAMKDLTTVGEIVMAIVCLVVAIIVFIAMMRRCKK